MDRPKPMSRKPGLSKGRPYGKRIGFKEKFWYKKDLDTFI